MSSLNDYNLHTTLWCLVLVTSIELISHVRGQENYTDNGEYDYYYTDPSAGPSEPTSDPPRILETTTTTFVFPSTTTPSFEIQQPTVPDISPIIEQIDQSCCAIPSLDCSMVNQQMMGASEDVQGVSFLDAESPKHTVSVTRQDMNDPIQQIVNQSENIINDFNSSRHRRQVELQEQYIDQLGINLLRFESCLCQANRSPSACRMLFPPGFYTPNRPGLFDVIFNGDLVVKRFRCSFYNGNIVDCLFQSSVSYSPLSAPMVYFVVNDKADLSGRQCITCNSMYCTFEAFKKRNLGSDVPFNQDYAECVATRSGTPLPKTTTTTPKPFWTGKPLTSSDHVLEDYDESASALRDLSQITRKGILMGLGRQGGQTMLAELYNIGPDLHSGHHPILHHDDHSDEEHDHHDEHYTWVIILAIVVGLLTGAVVIFVIVYCLRKRRGKVGVQRSLRGLPIVKLDVLDPSPFCGGGRNGGGVDADYEYKSGVSEISRSTGSLYDMTPGSIDSLKYSSGDAALPVARVVPFPKPARKPLKQPLPAPPPSRNTISTSSPNHNSRGEGRRLRGHSSSSSPNSRNRGNTAFQDDNDDVFLPRRPEIRARNVGASSISTRSDASSVHIYTAAAGKRPKVPPRSPANTLNNRSDNSSTLNFNQGSLCTKPQVAPRTPRNILRRHESASRTSSNKSTSSNTSLVQNNRDSNNRTSHSQRSNFAPSPVIHRSISKQRSNLPSTSSSRGSRGVQQGFYYDVDEDFDDYNDIYASIDEAAEGEEQDDDTDDDEVIENIRGKGHNRYETRICPSQEIISDVMVVEPVDHYRGTGGDQGGQYEVPVRSMALLNKPPPQIPTKPSRMHHLLPPSMTALPNTLPSTIAPPVPQRARPGSSSSSETDSSSVHDDPHELQYDDYYSSRPENEYTVIRDDLVQTGIKY